jgi:hypothetical protein
MVGLLLALLPIAAPATPAPAPAQTPVVAPELHKAELKGVDPGKYGGSTTAALAAYWTPAKKRAALANPALPQKRPNAPTAKAKPSSSGLAQRQAAVDPVSDATLPPEEALKIGELFYERVDHVAEACTAFLLPRGGTVGIIQTAAHCLVDFNGNNHINLQFQIGDTSFAVSEFVNGAFSDGDLFGDNFQRDFGFARLMPRYRRIEHRALRILHTDVSLSVESVPDPSHFRGVSESRYSENMWQERRVAPLRRGVRVLGGSPG